VNLCARAVCQFIVVDSFFLSIRKRRQRTDNEGDGDRTTMREIQCLCVSRGRERDFSFSILPSPSLGNIINFHDYKPVRTYVKYISTKRRRTCNITGAVESIRRVTRRRVPVTIFLRKFRGLGHAVGSRFTSAFKGWILSSQNSLSPRTAGRRLD